MAIPNLVKPQQIEHTLASDGKIVRVSGTLNLETKTLTASAKSPDGSQLNPEIRPVVERGLGQMYPNYSLILQY
jgi:hypothetical protein